MGRRDDLENELDRNTFVALVASEADGNISDEELAQLQAEPLVWARTLGDLLTETEEALTVVARSERDERDQALADLAAERESLAQALTRLTGEDIEPLAGVPGFAPEEASADDDLPDLPDVPVLQASWMADQVVLWAGNPSATSPDRDELASFIAEAGAGAVDWVPLAKGVALPSGQKAAAVAAPIGAALGWLVGVGAGQLAAETGASVAWMGEVATWATELVAQGRMVPSLRKATTAGGGKGNRQRTGSYAVQWVPAVVDRRRLGKLSARMPGPVKALDTTAKAERLCRAVLIAAVDAVCRTGRRPPGHRGHAAGGPHPSRRVRGGAGRAGGQRRSTPPSARPPSWATTCRAGPPPSSATATSACASASTPPSRTAAGC